MHLNTVAPTVTSTKSTRSELGKYQSVSFLTLAVQRRLLKISLSEVSTERRRFVVECPNKRQRIEAVGAFFLKGYHAALASSHCDQLHDLLNDIPFEYQGFAYEGAAMGVGLLDQLQPWRSSQFAGFLSSDLNSYPYLTHVGLGWALARFPGGMHRFCQSLLAAQVITTEASSCCSLLVCLVLDGYGFHQSYFNWERYVVAMQEPRFLPSDCLPIFRQGVGRSLCFVYGMDGDRVAKAIARFPPSSQADLWSGVGLAMAYAGGLSAADVSHLLQLARGDTASVAQGVAFAAKARQRAGFVPEHTQSVCQAVWGESVEKLSRLTDDSLADLPLGSMTAAYGLWRERIKQAFV